MLRRGAALALATTFIGALAAGFTPSSALAVTTSWPTYHLDPARTGNDQSDPALSNPVHEWTSPALDGQVYAEPLYLNNQVLVATENNTIYALDPSTGSVLWQVHLDRSVPLSVVRGVVGSGCGNIDPLGITGTPVIDPSRGTAGTLFAVEETWDGTSAATIQHKLVGVDLSSHAVTSHAVDPPGTVFRNGGSATYEQQRAALALAGGMVVVTYGGLVGDCGDYHGLAISLSEDFATGPFTFVVDPDYRGGGIWGPSGPAVDGAGNVYVATGNGYEPSSNYEDSDAVLKLNPQMQLLDYFAPSSWFSDNSGDSDLGSEGPSILQNGEIFQTGKQSTGFLLNPASLGHIGGQAFAGTACNSQAYGGTAYNPPYLYVPCTEGLRALTVDLSTSPPTFSRLWLGPTDATGPPIVAGGRVWVHGSSKLYGLDPSTGAPALTLTNNFGSVLRFTTPTAAGGHLIMASGSTAVSFSASPPTATHYVPNAPTRILDTRSGMGTCSPSCHTLAAGDSIDINVAAGDATVKAAVMNVTVTNTTGPPSFLTAYPTGASRPLASNLNYQPGVTVPNLVVVPVSQSGFVTAYNNLGSADVIFDLEGLFKTPGSGPAGLLRPLGPSRILDTRAPTRTGTCTPSPCATLGPHGRLDLQVAGSTGSNGSPSGVPASGAGAVVLNVTATNPSGPVSYLSVFPSGQTTPDPTSSSDLNFVAGQTVPNRVMVPLGSAGQVGIYNNEGTVDVAVDVVGYFTDATGTGTAGVYTALPPVRVLDSRSNTGNCSGGPCGTLGPQSQLTLQLAGYDGVPPVSNGSPSAVIVNVTATNGSTTSFLTAYPAGSARPLASDLNWVAGQTVPNLTPAKLSNGGAVTFFNNLGSVDVVADLEGWFS